MPESPTPEFVAAPRGQVPFRPIFWLASNATRALMALVFGTGREHEFGGEFLRDYMHRAGRPVIFACWHNTILAATRYLYRFHALRGRTVSPLASPSRDGDLITYVLEDFGQHVEVVRGSSKRGGEHALRALAGAVNRGRSIVLTVDGPRGPRYEAKPGAVQIAALTGAPIVPMSFASAWELRVRSTWDEFRVPLPGNHVRYLIGPPMWVPRDFGDHNLPFFTARLTARLLALTAMADATTARQFGLGKPRGAVKSSPLDTVPIRPGG